MKVGMVGMGKLGLPVALAIESKGHEVYGYDINPDVKTYLEEGEIPYREKDIEPLLGNNKVVWCDVVKQVVENSDIIFIPIQTPHDPQYEGATRLPEDRQDFDYTHLKMGVQAVANACAELGEKKTVAVISTCLPGTYDREIKPLLNENVDYVYTPQFIAMGTVLDDYLHPEFNLIGVENEEAADKLEAFYGTINDAPVVRTDVITAEGIKVSYNSWITAKTVLANSWGELSERLGMNFDDIKKAWDLSDRRLISTKYMDAGMSDGGGCHPRDNIAMSYIAEKSGMSHNVWEDLMKAREAYEEWHAQVAAEKAEEKQLPLVLLGKAFKPETDIETGSPAILVANILKEKEVEFTHENDIEQLEKAVYFIATQNERYKDYAFPTGSVVIDPFGYVDKQDGVEVVCLGRR